jgi:hypothetical protein
MVSEMNIKKIIEHYLLGKSVKEIELNRILDKLGKKKILTEREISFLNLYQITREDEIMDYMLLSKWAATEKIREFLANGKKMICNLCDKDGRFNLQITNAEADIDGECTIAMKGGETHKMDDKFLYNIIYDMKRDRYSLEEQGEYYEKSEIENGEK